MFLLSLSSNSKLGKGIATFSLPAVKTCPGRTKLCEKFCYAKSGFFTYPNVKKSFAVREVASKKESFSQDIISELKRRRSINAVRIHPSGDFYSLKYLNDWVAIAKESPNVKFWAYTRSWRLPRFVKALKELSELPNVELWASVDKETKTNETPPEWLRIADVVKDWTETPDKSYLECPNQKAKQITCAKCTYCFKPQGPKKIHVVFKEH